MWGFGFISTQAPESFRLELGCLGDGMGYLKVNQGGMFWVWWGWG